MELQAKRKSDDKGFNRTFMELKSQNMQIKLGESQSFNRTFMELK